MANIQIRHLETKLGELFRNKIDISDVSNEQERDNVFYSRAFAAYTLLVCGSVSIEDACNAIVDGRDDNGIDAIYFDRNNKNLWIVQSKLIKKGMGEPEVGDTHKFATGIKDLVDSKYDIFNRKIQNKQGEFDEALNDYEVKIRLVLAYTGSDSFSSHNQKVIDDLLNDLNDGSDIARFERFTLRQAHQALVSLNNN